MRLTYAASPALAIAVLGTVGCGGGAHAVGHDAGSDVARHDGAPRDGRDAAGDGRGMETTDAACGVTGWDAGAAAVVSHDQGMLVLAQIGIDGMGSGVFSASFTRAGQPVVPVPLLVGNGYRSIGAGVCDLGTFGPCSVTTTCAIPAPPCPAPQAGKLEFGPPDDLADEKYAPNPNGTYTPVGLGNGGGPIFIPGTLQAVAGLGGDVAPFSTQVYAPGCIALSQPAIAALGADAAPSSPRYVISRAQDLALAWTGGQSDATVGLDLISTAQNGDLVDVSCSFSAAGGQGTIPAQALAALGTGPVGGLYIYQQTSVSAQAGTFDVQFAVRNLGTGDPSPDAGTCPVNNGAVTFQ